LESHNISWKKEFSLQLNYLSYNIPYYAKTLEKYALIITMVEVQTWTPLENNTM
jgi:hypothetical protein